MTFQPTFAAFDHHERPLMSRKLPGLFRTYEYSQRFWGVLTPRIPELTII